MLAGEAASKLKVLTWRHISLLPSQAHVFRLIVWYLFPHFYTLERLTQSWLLLYELEIWRLFYSLCGRSFPFCEESSQNTALFGTRRQISPPPGGRDCGQLPSQSLYLNLKMTWTENQTLLTGGASHWKDSVSSRDHGGFLQDERSTFYLRVAASVGAAPGKRLKGAVCRFGRRNSDLRTISGR